jgi:Spy/CpxP family protein refolding chaperone
MANENLRCSWFNPRLLLAVASIFVAGVLAGALVMQLGLHDWMHRSAGYYPVGDKQQTLQQLSKELDLTPAQSEQLAMVLDDFGMYMQMLQSQMSDVRSNGKERILRILDDKQKLKFERMLGQIQQVRRVP